MKFNFRRLSFDFVDRPLLTPDKGTNNLRWQRFTTSTVHYCQIRVKPSMGFNVPVFRLCFSVRGSGSFARIKRPT